MRQLALRAAVNGRWRRKAPMPFSCPDFGALKIGPKTGKTAGGAIFTRLCSCEGTQGLTGAETKLQRSIIPIDGWNRTDAVVKEDGAVF